MKKLILALISASLITSVANAGSGSGKVDKLQVGHGYIWVKMKNYTPSSPQISCVAGDGHQEFTLDPSTETGKAFYSLILSAKAKGSELKVYGNNRCDHLSNFESISYILAE